MHYSFYFISLLTVVEMFFIDSFELQLHALYANAIAVLLWHNVEFEVALEFSYHTFLLHCSRLMV